MDSIVDHIGAPAAEVDRSGTQPTVVSVNTAFQDVFGLSSIDVEGTPLATHLVPSGGDPLPGEDAAGADIDPPIVERQATTGAQPFYVLTPPSNPPSDRGILVYVPQENLGADQTDATAVATRVHELQRVARELGTLEDEQAILDRAVAAANDLLAFEASVIGLIDDDAFVHRARIGEFEDTPRRIEIADLEERDYEVSALTAIESGEPIVRNDIGEQSPFGSLLTVPLGEMGVFQAADDEPQAFSEVDVQLAEILVSIVTEALIRRESEATLRAERDRFAALFDHIPDPLVAIEVDGDAATISDANAAFCEAFDGSDITGRDLHDVIDDGGDHAPWLDTPTTEEATELEIDDADGTRTFLTRVIDIGETAPHQRFVVFTDITQRRRLTERLRDRTEKFQELHHVGTELATCETADEIFELTVSALEDILAFDVCTIDTVEGEELVQRATGSGVTSEDTRSSVPISHDTSLAAETIRTVESIVIEDADTELEDEMPGPYRSLMSVPIDGYGVVQVAHEEPGVFDGRDLELLELLVAHVREGLNRVVSDRALRRERDKFAGLFTNIADPIVEASFVDGRSIVTDVNPAFEDTFGYEEHETLDRPLNELIVPPAAQDESDSIADRVAAGEPVEREVTRRTADGTPRQFLLRSVPLELDDSSVTHYFIYTDITEQKYLEQELKARNEKIQQLLEVGSELSAIDDEKTLFERAIKAAESVLAHDICTIDTVEDDTLILRATSTEMAQEEATERIDLETTDPEESLAVRTLDSGESIVNIDAEQAPYRSILSIPIDSVGIFQVGLDSDEGLDGAEIELTELFVAHLGEAIKRLRSERALRQERDKFATLFENVHDPVVEATFRDGRPVVEAVNTAFAETFGYEQSDISGEFLDEFIVPEGQLDEANQINAEVRESTTVEAEVRRQTPDGLRDFLLRTVPYGSTGDEPRVYAIYVDITEQSERIRKLQRLHAATRAQLEATETDSILELLHATAAELFATDAVELFEAAPGGDLWQSRDEPTRTIPQKAIERTETDEDAIIRLEDPPDVVLDASDGEAGRCIVVPIEDELILVISLSADGTFDDYDRTLAANLGTATASALQRTRREAALREREEELADQNERLDQFASIISHDLRNPLNLAEGHLELYRETGEEDHLEAVERGHNRMNKLIDDVLTLAREGQRSIEVEPIEVAALAREAWATINPPASATLQVDALDDARIEADRSRMTQIFENLFRNAVEHSGDDVTVAVTLSDAVLAIEDDGPGIDPDDRDNVFETGYTTDSSGTGLGLSIVHELANSHGWSARITDAQTLEGARIELVGVDQVE